MLLSPLPQMLTMPPLRKLPWSAARWLEFRVPAAAGGKASGRGEHENEHAFSQRSNATETPFITHTAHIDGIFATSFFTGGGKS